MNMRLPGPLPPIAKSRPARAARGVAWYSLAGLVMLMLVVVPPGGAVCWPLLNGWHVHIGWSDAAGRATPGLVVYSHRGPTVFINPHRAGFTAMVAPDTLNLTDMRPPLAALLWAIPALTLAWLQLPSFFRPRAAATAPLEQPPNCLALA